MIKNTITMRMQSMLKSISCFVLLFSLVSPICAQNDTIYYNAKWKVTVKDSASFYRPPIKKEGDLFRVQDYFIDGTLQMNGTSKSDEKDLWEGVVTWYNKDGSIHQQGNYTNGRLDGEFVTILNGKKLVAEFKNNRYITGQQNISCGGGMYLYTRQKGDTIIATMYGEDLNGLRYETYRLKDSKRGDLFTKYYKADGSYMGKKSITADGYVDGIEVDYYRSPMRIREVRTYDDQGYVFASDFYYRNGEFREKFEEEPELKQTYFSSDGKVLGELFLQMKNGKPIPWTGRQVNFYYQHLNEDNASVQTIRDYKNGTMVYEEMHYENQVIKSKTYYENGGKERQISFDETGKEIGSIEYANYLPINGVELIGDRKSTYKDGVLVSETNYYPKTKNVLSKKTDALETYYDKEGNELGVLKYDNANNYPKPWDGTRFVASYEGEVSSIEEYKNGYVTKKTSFRKRSVGDKKTVRFKNIETFEENGFDRLKEISFYSNGNKQSEIDYKKYEKVFGTFYDRTGKLLGTYDYIKKDGVMFEFFGDSDEVRLMEERKETKLLRSKVYTYGPNREYGAIDPVLIEDIDVNCCAKFYSAQGDLLAECTFKDQKPWSGTAYNTTERTKFTLKNGLRNGLYQKLDYNNITVLEEGQFKNDEEQGLFKYYDYNANLVRTDNFTNGELDGETIYYDTEGSVLAKLHYKNGKPIDGIKISKAYAGNEPTKETYEDGVLVERVSTAETGKRVTKYEEGQEKETTAYYPDSDKKRLSYSVENGYLEGTVIHYDTSGSEKHRATIEKGKLKEGTVYLTAGNIRGGASYIILEIESGLLKVRFMGKDDKVLFAAEEKLAFGTDTVFMQNLNIYMDYLGPDRLY